jgi:hypothetical protein
MPQNGVIVLKPARSWNLGGTMYAFDAVISEQHTSELTITDSPIETGSTISDHAYLMPGRLVIKGVVSDTPIKASWYDEDGNFTPPYSDQWSNQGDGPFRSLTAWQILKLIQAAAVPFDVQTGLQLYNNILIQRLETETTSQTAGALIFTADLREIQIVSTAYTTVPPRAAKPKRQGAAKKAVATKPGDSVPVDPDAFVGPPLPPEQQRSWVLQGLSKLGFSGFGLGTGGGQ